MYKNILTDERANLTPEHLKMMMIYSYKNVINYVYIIIHFLIIKHELNLNLFFAYTLQKFVHILQLFLHTLQFFVSIICTYFKTFSAKKSGF